MSTTVRELAVWRCKIQVAKFWGDWTPGAQPYAVDTHDGNMLMHGGVSALWEFAIGNPGSLPTFSTANAAIGVGDSSAAEAATQVDLQAATNKLRRGMNAGYPAHTDGTGSANRLIQFRSTFDTSQANFTWAEAAVFSSATAGAGRMLNRKVQAMGVKNNTASWQITFEIEIN